MRNWEEKNRKEELKNEYKSLQEKRERKDI